MKINNKYDNLKAIGYTSKGDRKEYENDSNGVLFCNNEDLISLEIIEGVKEVYCNNNLLTELIIPEGVIEINCWNNSLIKLNIPESVKNLRCDRNIKGLENVDWECYIRLF